MTTQDTLSRSVALAERQVPVCIVGNGAIAKTCALALAQAGFQVLMLVPPQAGAAAPRPSTDWDLRVYALNNTAHDLLSGLKVWGAMQQERIAPVEGMQIIGDAGDGSAGKLDFDAFSAHVERLAFILEDGNLNQALDTALRFAPNLEILPAQALALRSDEQRAELDVRDGSGQMLRIVTELLIGADGAQSWVRGQLDIGLDYRPYGQTAIVCNFACAKPHHGVAWQWFLSGQGILALLPLPGDQVSMVWSAPQALAAQWLHHPVEELARHVEELCANQFGALTPLPPQQARGFPLQLMRPHSVIAPHVALIGDAAHVVHPLAGHGMNLGFADIAALLQALQERAPQRSAGDAQVLAQYARARKEDVMLMQFTTDALARLFGSELGPLRAVRNLGLNLLDKFPVLKRQLIAQAIGK
ncbi:FAD-dependent monooxygenase [Massilia sp. W12]|uniref:FAD-dependent monooxygenase n=1 Tax=Massilia sp. W12 TaxID=3126507 RepID=UPI0030D07864